VIPLEQFPPDDLFQKIAAELNLSETAFVAFSSSGSLRIRWFTPKVEIKLCGHTTLAAAHGRSCFSFWKSDYGSQRCH
jgi:PhzF family phenazine biosynthesis protein